MGVTTLKTRGWELGGRFFAVFDSHQPLSPRRHTKTCLRDDADPAFPQACALTFPRTRAYAARTQRKRNMASAPTGYVAVSGVEHEPDAKPQMAAPTTTEATVVGVVAVPHPHHYGMVHRGEFLCQLNSGGGTAPSSFLSPPPPKRSGPATSTDE